ncbi:hypothetical protein AB0F96_30435 [Streptomyces sp. NPDC023998]|uniref:hypothetical protein n=1 Tax=Streptomyces sp. NPDC023998 TaxID=3154597 RepID=UPI0033CE8BF9
MSSIQSLPEHGSLEFYLATATVLPVLLIAYLFSMKVLTAIQELVQNNATVYMIVFGSIGPFVAICAAIAGEVASLLALFSGAPTATNALYSNIGLIAFPVVGFIHLIILAFSEGRAGHQ